MQVQLDPREADRFPAVRHSGGPSLVPLPSPPDGEIRELALDGLHHDAAVSGSSLFADHQLTMRRSRSAKHVNGARQQGGFVTDDEQPAAVVHGPVVMVAVLMVPPFQRNRPLGKLNVAPLVPPTTMRVPLASMTSPAPEPV